MPESRAVGGVGLLGRIGRIGRVGRIGLSLILLLTAPAAAHVPMVRGRLLELTRRADSIVIGKVAALSPGDVASVETLATLAGARLERFAVAANGNLAPGETHLLFVGVRPGLVDNIMPRGVIYVADPADAKLLPPLIGNLRAALARPEAAQPEAVGAALIPCLASVTPALRYDCAMTLNALWRDGHAPTGDQKRELDRVLAQPGADPAVRGLLLR